MPGAPTGVVAIGSAGSANVSWVAPLQKGGSPSSGYWITASPGGAAASAAATELSATVTGLSKNTAFTFTVVAMNGFGAGPASAVSNSITTADVPDAPSAVTATAASATGQAQVTWTAPASNGRSSITGYTITPYLGTAAGTPSRVAAVTSARVTGLSTGAAYTFTVTATNAVGAGAASAASVSITTLDVPGAPTSVSAARGNTQVQVSWTAPTTDGGSAITGYTVTPYIGTAAGTLVTVGNVVTTTVTGLTNGTAYTFAVSAINAVGTGTMSLASAPVTPTSGFNGQTGPAFTTRATPTQSLVSMMTYHPASFAYLYNMYPVIGQSYDPVADTWTTLASSNPSSGGQTWFAMAPVGSALWAIWSGSIYKYVPATDVWTTEQTALTGPQGSDTTESDENGHIFAVQGTNVVDYDTVAKTITYYPTGLSTLSEPRIAYDPGVRALFFGAYPNVALHRMDLTTHAVTTMTPTPSTQLGDIFCGDRSGHIYSGGAGGTTTMYQYTVSTDAWATIPSLPAAKTNSSTCTVSETGYLYVGDASNLKLYRIQLF